MTLREEFNAECYVNGVMKTQPSDPAYTEWLEDKINFDEKANPQNVFHFELGYKSAQKRNEVILKDKLNAVKSKLSEEEVPKLGKTLPNKRTEYYSAQKEAIEELLKKM